MYLKRKISTPLAITIILVLAILVGAIDYLEYREIKNLQLIVTEINMPAKKKVISTFKDCVTAGHPLMGSFPRQCETPEGRVFIEEITDLPGEGAGWSFYKSDQYGFEVKYPASYLMNQDDVIRPDAKEGEEWRIHDGFTSYYLVSFIEDVSTYEELGSLMQNEVDIILEVIGSTTEEIDLAWRDTFVAGERAIEMSHKQFSGDYTKTTYRTGVLKDSNAFVFDLLDGVAGEYYEMLATFKFLR